MDGWMDENKIIKFVIFQILLDLSVSIRHEINLPVFTACVNLSPPTVSLVLINRQSVEFLHQYKYLGSTLDNKDMSFYSFPQFEMILNDFLQVQFN